MELTTNLRKMRTSLDINNQAQYILPQFDILENTGSYFMNPLVGSDITLQYQNEIHCVVTGKKIKQAFGEGMSYNAWMTSPQASPSIVRPELSRIHEGIALRDKAWEEEHHMQPHYVYLSRTSDIKVGVTRTINVPSRWIDQGATEAIVIAETPYRQLAGLIEVELKNYLPDKTAWQAMLKNEQKGNSNMVDKKNEMLAIIGGEYEHFIFDDDKITSIHYPVLQDLKKVKSLKLDNTPDFRGKLLGIKGQYLIFEDGHVFNVRSHAGYRVKISAE